MVGSSLLSMEVPKKSTIGQLQEAKYRVQLPLASNVELSVFLDHRKSAVDFYRYVAP